MTSVLMQSALDESQLGAGHFFPGFQDIRTTSSIIQGSSEPTEPFE